MRAAATTQRPGLRRDDPQAVRGGAATWMRNIRLSWFTVLMILVVVLFVIIIAPGVRVFIQQRQQVADRRAQVERAQAQNSALQSQVARWSDPAYIRAQARERLYYVMPGETSLLVINDVPADAAPGQAAPTSAGIQTTKVDWLSSLFASGMAAGLSTSTPEQLEQSGQLAPAGADGATPTGEPMPPAETPAP